MTLLKHSRTLEVLGHADEGGIEKYDMRAIFRDDGIRLDHDCNLHYRLRTIIRGKDTFQPAFEGRTLVIHAFSPRQDYS